MSVTISIRHAVKRYGSVTVIPDLSINIQEGELFTLLGPSGCGKTTLLRMIAGFNSIEGGEFRFNDKVINDMEPGKRDIGMVFQNYAIFPNLSVRKNVEFGLKYKHMSKEDMRQEVDKFLQLVHVDQYADRMPERLSGGQQQRVALARALILEPGVLLFDEPLSNLDAKLRVSMRTEIRKIQQKVGITAIYVTHDQSEAMSISDKIIIMSKGKVEQIGTPREIYYHPNSRFVADFIGEANFLEAQVLSAEGDKARIQVAGETLEVNNYCGAKAGSKAALVIRPEAASLAEQGYLEATVMLSTFMGAYQYYQVAVGDMEIQITDYNPVNRRIYQAGETAYLDFDSRGVYIL